MFSIIKSLTKVVVGVVLETPVAVASDVATMCGALTDQDTPYTAQALKKIYKNVADMTDPDKS